MAGGFFKNVGVDVRQLIEESFLEEYKFKFVFLDEAFKYRYVRYNNCSGEPEEQIYTYKSLLRELQKNNINITDIDIMPVDTVPMFGMLRLVCLFKDKEKKPAVIKVVSQSLEHIMDDYYSDDAKV